MRTDDEICMCFHVSQRKVQAWLQREKPTVASQLSNCLDAGTGCGWCRPFLEQLYRQWKAGEPIGLTVDLESYCSGRDRHLVQGSDTEA
ncbi:MAG: (2Fe-2S)-binding protein [Phycisphaerales bacterium]|nr:(2Fe-2S)-binding protein [Phycisphaerales bacterium]MDP6890902.1 (2Fe-2S)-binding protein [Phycisphaerales bacterium]